MGRILAVDLGTKRVGLAITDPLQVAASPLETVPYRSRDRLVERLAALVRERGVETVVIGLPVDTEGREGEACRRSRNLAKALEAEGISTALWDERYSSKEAEETLLRMGARPRRAPERVDRIAAAIILREYLDARQGKRAE